MQILDSFAKEKDNKFHGDEHSSYLNFDARSSAECGRDPGNCFLVSLEGIHINYTIIPQAFLPTLNIERTNIFRARWRLTWRNIVRSPGLVTIMEAPTVDVITKIEIKEIDVR